MYISGLSGDSRRERKTRIPLILYLHCYLYFCLSLSVRFQHPSNHEWRKLCPAGIRKVVVKSLSVSPASIGLIKPVRLGFALSPCSNESKENLLAAAGGLFMSGAKKESATNWSLSLCPQSLDQSQKPKTVLK